MEILMQLWTDIVSVLFLYLIFGLSYVANVILSLYYNTKVLNMRFIKGRFYNGILKALVIIVGSLMLVISIDLFMIASELYIFEYSDLLSIAMVLSTVGYASILYIKEAFMTLQDILCINRGNE